jgi:hypothetical protein
VAALGLGAPGDAGLGDGLFITAAAAERQD